MNERTVGRTDEQKNEQKNGWPRERMYKKYTIDLTNERKNI